MRLKEILRKSFVIGGFSLLSLLPLNAQDNRRVIDIPEVKPEKLTKVKFSPLALFDKNVGHVEYYPIVAIFSYFNENGREDKRYFYSFEQKGDGSVNMDLVAFWIDLNGDGIFEENEQFKVIEETNPPAQVSKY